MAVSNGKSGNVDERSVAVGKKLCEVRRTKSELALKECVSRAMVYGSEVRLSGHLILQRKKINTGLLWVCGCHRQAYAG